MNLKASSKARTTALVAGAALFGSVTGASITLATRAAPPHAATVDRALLRPAAFQNGGASLADVVQSILPAVVQIQVREKAQPGPVGAPMDGPFGDLFRQFFGANGPDAETAPPDEVLGSGFIISSDGLVVTNNHVVDGNGEIRVKLADGRELPATLVGRDDKTDLAVLRMRTSGRTPVLNWGDSDHLRIGDDVIAVGSPFGLGGTVTKGIVSGRGRQIGAGPYDEFIQVDAPINQGNSGGPLLDGSGRVVGVNTAIFTPSGGSVGIGFAIPANVAHAIVAQIVAHGRVARGQIGVQVQDVTPEIADSLGRDGMQGALVAAVVPNSTAAQAGLKPGDVITSFDGQPVKDAHDLSKFVAASPAGARARVALIRGGHGMTAMLRVAAMAGAGAGVERANLASPAPSQQSLQILGFTVRATSPELNAEAGQPQTARGLIITTVDPASRSAEEGIRPGDLISAVNNTPVATPKELAASVSAARHAGRNHILLSVARGDEQAFVPVPIG